MKTHGGTARPWNQHDRKVYLFHIFPPYSFWPTFFYSTDLRPAVDSDNVDQCLLLEDTAAGHALWDACWLSIVHFRARYLQQMRAPTTFGGRRRVLLHSCILTTYISTGALLPPRYFRFVPAPSRCHKVSSLIWYKNGIWTTYSTIR